jgi:integrase/recombinase XerD
MIACLNTDGAMSRRYVQQLRLRSTITLQVYRSILNSFCRFVVDHSAGRPLSVVVIREWLCNRKIKWPPHLVLHRARLVDRFLDWMVATGSLPNNPIAELRKLYAQRTTAPIVRALLTPDFANALEALRRQPRFGSFLGVAMRDHVAFMKSIGYRYDWHEQHLLRFDRFLQRRPDLSGQPVKVLVREWTNAESGSQHAFDCHQAGRALSKALRRINPTIEPIAFDRRLQRQAQQLHRRPHIYTVEDVHRLLEAAKSFPSPQSPLRPLVLYIMLVLAYCAGLRLGEIVRLNVGDIHLEDETIEIRDTKFFKSRRLPLSRSVISALRHYLDARHQAGAPHDPSSGLFWHQKASGRYSYQMGGKLLVSVLQRAGLKPAKGRVGPRVHDIRHAFVVNRMIAWYREGINPQSRLPYLATYLGHKDINSTLVYLTITQDLLQQASERFRVRGARVLQASNEGGNA